MTGLLPPLPTPYPAPVRSEASPGLRVESLPLPGSQPLREAERRSLPSLSDFTLRPAETWPPSPPEPVWIAAETPPVPEPEPDFTDSDLASALLPLVATRGIGFDFHDDSAFEAVLRTTFRRALAEQHSGPFDDPDFAHRILWRAQALFTGRSYDEVLADKIRRFHVEEVYLLDHDKLSLISYASNDPVRHAHPRKVGSFARQLALRVKDESGALQLGFELGENRRTFVRPGKFCHLVAVIRGEINDLVKADLDFALRRIETRFHEPFVQGQPLLRELQPLLEECLLIHSPAAPAAS